RSTDLPVAGPGRDGGGRDRNFARTAERNGGSASMKPWIQIASRWTASLVAALGLTLSAPAQTAPAGNEHPDQRLPVDQAPNPLAPATSTEPVTREQKWAFARQVDLSPLSTVAVMTGSRVGILDTVARELVRSVTGRPY